MNTSLLPRPGPAGLGRSLSGRAVALLVLAVVMGLLQLVHAAAPANADEVCFLDADGRLSCPSDEPEPGPTYAPPELVNPRLLPELPEWAASVRRLEEQAVGATLRQHDLPPSDRDAVLSWARADALANLWTLLTRAAGTAEAERTVDQQRAVYWLVNLVRDHEVLTATTVGEQYVRWAGLDLTDYRRLVDSGAGRGELTAFLTTLAQPLQRRSVDRVLHLPLTGSVRRGVPGVPGADLLHAMLRLPLRRPAAQLRHVPPLGTGDRERVPEGQSGRSQRGRCRVRSHRDPGAGGRDRGTGRRRGPAPGLLRVGRLLLHGDHPRPCPFRHAHVRVALPQRGGRLRPDGGGRGHDRDRGGHQLLRGARDTGQDRRADRPRPPGDVRPRGGDAVRRLGQHAVRALRPSHLADPGGRQDLRQLADPGGLLRAADVRGGARLGPGDWADATAVDHSLLEPDPRARGVADRPALRGQVGGTGEVTAQEAISVRLVGADGQADQTYSLRARGGWLVTRTAGGDCEAGPGRQPHGLERRTADGVNRQDRGRGLPLRGPDQEGFRRHRRPGHLPARRHLLERAGAALHRSRWHEVPRHPRRSRHRLADALGGPDGQPPGHLRRRRVAVAWPNRGLLRVALPDTRVHDTVHGAGDR